MKLSRSKFHRIERPAVCQLLETLEIKAARIDDPKAVYGEETAADAIVVLPNCRRIGIQHTVYHGDYHRPLTPRLRAKEKQVADAGEIGYFFQSSSEYKAALQALVQRKLLLTFNTKQFDELWLLVSAQNYFEKGAFGSTLIQSKLIEQSELDQLLTVFLRKSCYKKAFLMLHGEGIAFAWERCQGWTTHHDALQRLLHNRP